MLVIECCRPDSRPLCARIRVDSTWRHNRISRWVKNRIRAAERRPRKVKLESPTLTGNLQNFPSPEKTVWVPLQARTRVDDQQAPHSSQKS
jgi:hypothetical protein